MAAGDINDPLSQIPGIALADNSTDPADIGAGYALLKFKSGQLIWLPNGGALTRALDDLTPGQLHAITQKASPVDADELLIEDSEDAWAKKRVPLSALPGGASGYPALSGARLTKSATQSAASDTNTIVTFDGEAFDDGGYHDNATNNTRLTVPATGAYLIGATIRMAALGANVMHYVSMLVDGTVEYSLGQSTMSVPPGALSPGIGFTTLAKLTANQYVEVQVYNGYTQATNITQSFTGTMFWIVRVA